MTSARHTPRTMLLLTLLAGSLAVAGCKKSDGGKDAPGKSKAKAPDKAMTPDKATTPDKAMTPDKATTPDKAMTPDKTAVAPARPAPPPRLAPLPWPPAKIKTPRLRATCKSLCGIKAKGNFFDKCPCRGKGLKSPLAARKTSKYHKFFKAYEFEVVNLSSRPITWGSVNIYYYDAYGKQLTAVLKDPSGKRPDRKYKRYEMNGSTIGVPANTTKMITMGWSKGEEPKGTVRVEAVFDGWCWGKRDKKTFKERNQLCVRTGRPPKDRPMTK